MGKVQKKSGGGAVGEENAEETLERIAILNKIGVHPLILPDGKPHTYLYVME